MMFGLSLIPTSLVVGMTVDYLRSSQSCALPGLFYQVSPDQDISAAMQQMFGQAVSTAHLSK
jgi:hypothetical protein